MHTLGFLQVWCTYHPGLTAVIFFCIAIAFFYLLHRNGVMP